jgi:ABC-2 type transport system ATP-binding protein
VPFTVPDTAVQIDRLNHWYGARHAVQDLDLSVAAGEVFGLLGPNGGGKTTLFRIVSTLLRPTSGSVSVFGQDVVADPTPARRQMGVVFQSPALDVRLTVEENLRHHGHLYGLHGRALARRIDEVLDRGGLTSRRRDMVLTLSGGLRRRTEVAKALLHAPKLLVLDEPSTGLDPAARRELWADLRALRERQGTTIMLTTHLMDEGAGCDRVAILHEGRLVAGGAPAALVDAIGGDVVWVTAREAVVLAPRIAARFGLETPIVDGRIRIERQRGHEFITELVEAFPGDIDAVTFGKPTLEDVFVHHTGHRLEEVVS